MPRVFRQVASALFKLDEANIEALIARSAAIKPPKRPHPRRHLAARAYVERDGLWGDEEADGDDEVFISAGHNDNEQTVLRKRQVPGASTPPAAEQPPPSLRCRGTLHTDPKLTVLNTPVYIATDSRTPLTDRNLKLFFDTFPCAFVLSDLIRVTDVNWSPVLEFKKLESLRSADDGLKLDKFLYPLLEAVIAAKVRSHPAPQGPCRS